MHVQLDDLGTAKSKTPCTIHLSQSVSLHRVAGLRNLSIRHAALAGASTQTPVSAPVRVVPFAQDDVLIYVVTGSFVNDKLSKLSAFRSANGARLKSNNKKFLWAWSTASFHSPRLHHLAPKKICGLPGSYILRSNVFALQ
jgi:hypothetical protein